MTPTRVPGSNNLRFNRYVKGVGRITNSAGTENRQEFHYRDGLLTKLKKAGAIDTLRLFKQGTLTMHDLIVADRLGQLERVGERLRLAKPLAIAIEEWLPTSADAAASRKRYEVSWTHFERRARELRQLRAQATVQDLGQMDLDKLRRGWDASPADWNRARAMLSAFLTRFLGHVHHPFRLEVMGRMRRRQEPPGRMPEVTVDEFWKIIGKAPDHAQPAYVAMAVLGAGPREYLRLEQKHLHQQTLAVDIPGTKTRERARTVAVDERMWQWIVRAVPAPLAYGWLRTYWVRACTAAGFPKLWMYDLRHLSAQLAADGGATDRDLTVHMGHTNPAMSHRYSRRRTARRVAKAIGDALGERLA